MKKGDSSQPLWVDSRNCLWLLVNKWEQFVSAVTLFSATTAHLPMRKSSNLGCCMAMTLLRLEPQVETVQHQSCAIKRPSRTFRLKLLFDNFFRAVNWHLVAMAYNCTAVDWTYPLERLWKCPNDIVASIAITCIVILVVLVLVSLLSCCCVALCLRGKKNRWQPAGARSRESRTADVSSVSSYWSTKKKKRTTTSNSTQLLDKHRRTLNFGAQHRRWPFPPAINGFVLPAADLPFRLETTSCLKWTCSRTRNQFLILPTSSHLSISHSCYLIPAKWMNWNEFPP